MRNKRLYIPTHQEKLIKSIKNPQKFIRDLVNADMQSPQVLELKDHSTKSKSMIVYVPFNAEEWAHVSNYEMKSAFVLALIDNYVESLSKPSKN